MAMLNNSSKSRFVREVLSVVAIVVLLAVTTPFAFVADKTYETEQVVSEGKKTKETDAVLTFKDESFSVMPDKQKFKSAGKEFDYSDIRIVDYSYSKKPMLSGGGAVAVTMLVCIVCAVPFLFIKKKNHWMTIRTETDFAALKLGRDNFRQIIAEFETHGVKVNTLEDEDDKKKEGTD